jgi:DNA polymerase-1
LVLEVPVDELDEVTALTRQVMENVIELRVPLRVDIGSGGTLADTK